MDNEKDFEVVNDETFSLQYVFQYVKENFIGLLLLLLAFYIIYFVDYISRINALMFAMPSPIPGVQPATNNISAPKINKPKRSKK